MESNRAAGIAKNTLYLYVRMFVTMCVSIYTSRIILQGLGVEDYGLYNVVGGVVGLMNFFINALSFSYQRFFCIELTKNENNKFKQIFGTALTVSMLWSVIIILILETGGYWLINHKIVIPAEKMWQANAIFQFSILSFILGLFQSVYSALIISNERMSFFALLSILEAGVKLAVAFLIGVFASKKLFFYGALMLAAHLLVLLSYMIYSLKNFNECRVFFCYRREYIKQLFGFCSWTLIGTFSNVLQTQGGSILLNVFFGPIVNAARAISFQIYTAVITLTRGFQTAFSPTMLKTYEQGDHESSFQQIITTSKISIYLTFLLSVPFFVSTDLILNLWLGTENVPKYTAQFIRMIIVIGLLEAVSTPVVNVIYASGKIKSFQIAIGCFTLLVLPISYILLKIGMGPESLYYVTMIFALISILIRIFFLKGCMDFGLCKYIKNIFGQAVLFSFLLFAINFISPIEWKNNIALNILIISLVEILSLGFIYILLLNKQERNLIKRLIKR
ncbi:MULTISPECIES: lipopolysaccharide biosynthesis protein [Parabacteroides]|jgi:O-antigen/teichoic acid export membrane protein|uniref:lipopolysaccharide biosynthesis protein n=1 Tax=Parabacteroides TaxID=375288 RepID=UPI00202F8949|nr:MULTISPECIES: hypothetical protein [unclassified Parabacteroides]MCM0713719.1 hypothetical protein [Parabacteroides sp. TA-V-105]